MTSRIYHLIPAWGLSATLLLAACGDGTPLGSREPADPADGSPREVIEPMDHSIDPNDTYVMFDATREQSTSMTSSDPVYDASTDQETTSLNLAPPLENIHVEAGYDAGGQVRVNEYRQPSGLDPYATPVDETQQIQVAGDQVSAVGPEGVTTIEPEPGTDSPYPLEELGSTAYAQITDGVVLSENNVRLYDMKPSLLAGRDGVTRVERTAGRLRMITIIPSESVAGSADARLSLSPAPGENGETKVVRSYGKRNDRWILEEVEVTSASDNGKAKAETRQTMRLKNVRWHENREKDRQRKEMREKAKGPGTSSAPPVAIRPSPATARPRPPVSGPRFDVQTCDGVGTNVVFQHGFASSEETWSYMSPWMSQDFYLGCKLIPSLNAQDRQANQAEDLIGRMQQFGHGPYVMIGHSQGGMISRYVAQNHPELVSGVVTIGTPHHGVPITRTARPVLAGVLGGLTLLAGSGCTYVTQAGACKRVAEFTALAMPVLVQFGADASVPAFVDLKPGSDFQHQRNAVMEGFPRVGIQSYPKKLFVEWRLYGDAKDGPAGWDGGRRQVKRAEGFLISNTACGVVGWLVGNSVMAGRCAQRAAGVVAVTLAWNVLTVGFAKGDGIVTEHSQVYPNALRNYAISNGDSHTGETKSDKTRDELRRTLLNWMGVQKKPTW